MKATCHSTEPVCDAACSRSSMTDEALLLAYRETGEREFFAQLVARYELELFNYLKRVLGNTELAEDTFQASFLQVHLKADQFKRGRRFRPWLYAIATNQAIDTKRSQARKRAMSLDSIRGGDEDSGEGRRADWLVSPEPNPGARADAMESRELLQRALNQLSEQMRTVIHLVYYQGLKYREAAEVLAVPVGTIKSRLHTAIAQLTEFWNKHHAESD